MPTSYQQKVLNRIALYESCSKCGADCYPQKTPTGEIKWRHVGTHTIRCDGLLANITERRLRDRITRRTDNGR